MEKVCILTTGHSLYDDRIYHKEVLSLSKAGYKLVIIAPLDRNVDKSGEVEIIGVKKPVGRLGRFTIKAAQIFKAAISQHEDVYHSHDPNFLPWMTILSVAGKQVIYDVHENNGKTILAKTWLPSFLRKPLAACVDWLEGGRVDFFQV